MGETHAASVIGLVALGAGCAYWFGWQQAMQFARKLERFGIPQAAWQADREPDLDEFSPRVVSFPRQADDEAGA